MRCQNCGAPIEPLCSYCGIYTGRLTAPVSVHAFTDRRPRYDRPNPRGLVAQIKKVTPC